MIDEEILVDLIREAVDEVRAQGKKVVFDGQPGSPEQIEIWRRVGLLDLVEAVIILDVPHEESIARLKLRGRADDRMEVWMGKIRYFEQKIYSFLTPVRDAKIPVFMVDGMGDIETVNDRIMQKIEPII
jgi:adenylate kinase